MKNLDKQFLNSLPQETKDNVLSTLKAFNECTLIFSNGCYQVSVAYFLLERYSEDYKVIGCFSQKDIYTIEERVKNFREEFGYDDHSLLRKMKAINN